MTYSLSGTDAESFDFNTTSGILTFKASPDFETQSNYIVSITASDDSGNSASQDVSIAINDLDDLAPVITSGTSVTVNENIVTTTTIYTALATDAGTVTYSLSGTDAASFDFNTSSGVLTFKASPDFETKSSYTVTITATDHAGNNSSWDVTITINDLDEVAPVFTSGTLASVDENTATTTTIYTAVATDASTVTYSLGGTDAGSFDFNTSSGLLTFKASPDFETKSSYIVSIMATDAAGNSVSQDVAITINDQVDEAAPVFTSGTLASVDENTAITTTIYTAVATDAGTVNYDLGGADAASFDFNSNSGVLTFKVSPDFETQSSYKVSITATDEADNSTSQDITITVNDLDEVAPVFTSDSSTSVDENTAATTTIYTAVATDEGTVTYSLGGTDAGSFDFNTSNGVLTFKALPDFETQSSYTVSITATDEADNSTSQDIMITINDLDEVAPVFTSGTSISVDENIATTTTIYTAVAADEGTVTYSIGGADAGSFDFNTSSGVLTFKESPDFETQSNYTVNITATDGAGNSASQDVTITVNDQDEVTEVLSVEISKEVTVFPNPFKTHITITDVEGFVKAIIYDLNGRDVLWSEKQRIDLSKIESGVYTLMIFTNEDSFTRTIIKE